jgi:DNA polymerase (family 10)
MVERLTNKEFADLFETIARMLEIKGESVHRVLAYRRAAETIAELPRDLYAIHAEGTLTDLPNIGKTLAEKIDEIATTGQLEFYERLSAEIPAGVVDMLNIPGLGPKKAALFWKELDVTSVEQLKAAAESDQLAGLPGMGAKSQAKVLEGIESLARRTDRISIGTAYPIAERILGVLRDLDSVLQAETAGSLRRWRATVGDIDLLVASYDPAPIMETFVNLPEVARVLGHGPTKSSIETHGGQQVDLRVLPPERYGTLLAYFTGSKAHNVKMRELALKQGLSLNEHAFTPVNGGAEILCETEEQVFEVLGLPWIPPELREDTGEIDAGQANALPDLITLDDVRGDLQMHTTWSDGQASIMQMAEAALARGLDYILITDHSQSLGVAGGLTPERLAEQRAEIDEVNAALEGRFTVLHGTEVEIRGNGALDFPDEVLATLDIVLASLHIGLRQPRQQVTDRVLAAIRNPHVSIIGHPRGRLIPDREPADLDMDAIFQAALENDVALEINANPRRLDLDGTHARRAIEMGIKLTISTDAHSPEELALLHYGVATARRGWVTADSVANTWPLEDILAWVRGRSA